MFRILAPVLAVALMAAPALAAPAISSEMPAITASLSGETIRVRLAEGVASRTRAGLNKVIVVEGFDAAGQSLGSVSADVSKRLTYASIDLTPAMVSAASFTVMAQ